MPRKTHLNVVTSDPQAEQDEAAPVYKIELLSEHYPALTRWMQEKNDENLIALFNVVYPGAGKLPLAQFIPMLSSFRVALDEYFKQTQGGTK